MQQYRQEEHRSDVMIDVLLSEVSSVFIPEDYSRQRTRMAKSRMGEEEA